MVATCLLSVVEWDMYIQTYLESCTRYIYIIHAYDIKRSIHSQRIHSYHTCIWVYNDFMIHLVRERVVRKEIIDSSKDCLGNGNDLHIFKVLMNENGGL